MADDLAQKYGNTMLQNKNFGHVWQSTQTTKKPPKQLSRLESFDQSKGR